MFDNILQDWTRNFLRDIKPQDFPEKSYLGGGTAIALQLGHRRSVDLDFFTPTKFIESQWEQSLEEDFKFKLVQRDEQALIGTVGKVKLSLMGYKYKLIGRQEKYHKINVASLTDLAAMKLDTVINRGAKRDFIDLYFLAKKYGLEALLEFYERKFENLQDRALMIKKGLIYFEMADKEYMPEMLVPADWKQIKSWFIQEVRKV